MKSARRDGQRQGRHLSLSPGPGSYCTGWAYPGIDQPSPPMRTSRRANGSAYAWLRTDRRGRMDGMASFIHSFPNFETSLAGGAGRGAVFGEERGAGRPGPWRMTAPSP